jgi:hypothetical protein
MAVDGGTSDPAPGSAEDEERERRMDQMRADIRLKNTQAAAEWPKVFTAILVAVFTGTAAVFTIFGYNLHH